MLLIERMESKRFSFFFLIRDFDCSGIKWSEMET